MRAARPAVAAIAVGALIAGPLAGCSFSGNGSDRRRPAPAASGPLYTGPAATGVAHPLGMKWDWPRADRFAPYLQTLSGGATFYQFAWCDVEPTKGTRSWDAVDRVAAATRRLGYTLMLKIRIGSCWVNGDRGGYVRGRSQKSSSAPPDDMAAYTGFVRAAVARYAPLGVRQFALENEANAKMSWNADAAAYERLLRAGAAAVRSADPRAEVVDSGLSSTAYGVVLADRLLAAGSPGAALDAYRRYYTRRVATRADDFPPAATESALRAALADEQARRNLEFFAATVRLARDRIVDVAQLHFYEAPGSLPAVLALLRRSLPAGMPIEAWEVGSFRAGADAVGQAAEMTKAVALLLTGGVRRVIWLPLAVDPAGRNADEPRYGLLEPSGSEREAGRVLATLAAAARTGPARPVAASGISGAVWSGTGGATLAVWSDGGGRLAIDPAPERVRRLGADPAAGSVVPLGLSPTPTFVTVRKPLRTLTGLPGDPRQEARD